MSTLWQDLRFAARTFGRAPGFFALAAVVLAIGIGANSAIFSLVDAALLRPFPFADPARLAMLWEKPPGFDHNRVSPLNLVDWTEQNQVFSSMAGVVSVGRTLITPAGEAERIPGQLVTSAFFDVLGVKPFAGRTFSAEDAQRRAPVVVIGENLWRHRFGADPKLLGGTLQLDGRPFNVIGIAPSSFQILDRADLWVLFNIGRNPENRRAHFLQVIGRLKPGVNFDQAGAGMAVVAQNIARISPETNKDWGVTIEPLRQALIGRELRVTSLVLAGVVGFVLLMACANVANLLLVRGSGRTREIAVRASLGGSRARIARQLLTESVLLAVAGGALQFALAWTILRGAPSFLPPARYLRR